MSFSYQVQRLPQSQDLLLKTKADLAKQNDFMTKMLVAQLKNQTPGNEFNADEMLKTIIGMMGTSQQLKTNELLQENIEVNRGVLNMMMGSYQGEVIEHDSDRFDFQGTEQDIFYKLPKNVSTAHLTLFDEKGKKFQDIELSTFDSNVVISDIPKGRYSFKIEGKDTDGNEVPGIESWIKSEITGIEYGDSGPILMAGDEQIGPLRRCKKFYPSLQPTKEPEKIDLQI
jgi:flagellar hook assembly protein FlgD